MSVKALLSDVLLLKMNNLNNLLRLHILMRLNNIHLNGMGFE